MSTANDVVWWWNGGRERGEWRPAFASKAGPWASGRTLRQVKADCERAGYVAVLGTRSIGAPEGPPSEEDFRRVGV